MGIFSVMPVNTPGSQPHFARENRVAAWWSHLLESHWGDFRAWTPDHLTLPNGWTLIKEGTETPKQPPELSLLALKAPRQASAGFRSVLWRRTGSEEPTPASESQLKSGAWLEEGHWINLGLSSWASRPRLGMWTSYTAKCEKCHGLSSTVNGSYSRPQS